MTARLPGRVPLDTFVHLRTFAVIIPWVVALNTVAAVDRFDPQLIATWVVIHLVTILCAGLPVVLAKYWLHSRGLSEISAGLIVSLGVLAGLTKGTLTAVSEAIAGFTEDWTDNLLIRAIGASFAAVWLLLLTSYARLGLQRLSTSREALVRQNVATRLATEASPASVELIEPLRELEQLRARVAAGTEQPSAQTVLRVVDGTIRPLSRALWKAESARYPEITLRALFRLTLQSGKLPSLLVATMWAATSFTALAIPVGLVASAVYNLAAGVIAAVVWSLFGRVASRVVPLALPAVIALSQLSVMGGALLASTVVPGLLTDLGPLVLIFGGVWMTLVVVGASIVAGAIDIAQMVARDLASTETQRAIHAQAESDFLKQATRRLALELHGDIQSRLVAIAAALESGRLTNRSVLAELDTVITSLTRLEGREPPADRLESPARRLAALVASWEGLLEVHIDNDSGLALEEAIRSQPEVIDVLREALTNAFRHGRAKTVSITALRTGDHFAVSVGDNGYGPRHGSPGVGSALIDRLSDGAWTLEGHPAGGAQLRVTIPAVAEPH